MPGHRLWYDVFGDNRWLDHSSIEDLAPRVPDRATPHECVAMWLDLLDTCEQFLLAGLRREIGPDGDLEAAYRQWYADRMDEHERTLQRLAQRLNASGGGSGR